MEPGREVEEDVEGENPDDDPGVRGRCLHLERDGDWDEERLYEDDHPAQQLASQAQRRVRTSIATNSIHHYSMEKSLKSPHEQLSKIKRLVLGRIKRKFKDIRFTMFPEKS